MSEKEWSRGRLVNGAKQLPSIRVDCSKWASDIPADQWSRGQTINGAKQIPGSPIDCSKWGLPASVWLAVQVTYSQDTPKEVVAKHTFALIEKLQALAPELRLEYDEGRSREYAQERSVVVAVSPTTAIPDLEERLYALLPKVRTSEPNVPITGVDIRWDQPLAA